MINDNYGDYHADHMMIIYMVIIDDYGDYYNQRTYLPSYTHLPTYLSYKKQ